MVAQADLTASIKKAIGAHGLWKTRLQDAVRDGKTEFDPREVALDNKCDFGKWLTANPALKESRRYETVRKLHADFHKEVARILTMAVAGKNAEALAAMEPKTSYAKLSGDLTSEMLAWSRE